MTDENRLRLPTRLAERKVMLLDGATGTELEQRGVPMDGKAWSATAVLTHPDVVREIHVDYIKAGAEVITANTFSLAKHVLLVAGLQDEFRQMNAEAVKLARVAREECDGEHVAVAGSIAPISFGKPGSSANAGVQEIAAWFEEQAEVLVESGVDLLVVEMIGDLERASLAVQAACATGVPVWLGFSCRKDSAGRLLLWDGRETLSEGVASIAPLGGSAALIMHTDVGVATEALGELKRCWNSSSGPLGIYAHSGYFIMPSWQFTDISPGEYADKAQDWIEMGARIVGGCCGIGPSHIRELKERYV